MSGAIVLIDRIHHDVLQHPEALDADVARCQRRGVPIALIDGTGEASLRRRRPGLVVDLLIAPYAGEVASHNETARFLAGPAFAPLGADYENLAARAVRPIADRVLISCGGSDPFEVTATAMKALTNIRARRLTVRVVLGPGFPSTYRAGLREISRNSAHAIEWIESPNSLAALMHWSDVAVATSGLTKYELAATGTPAILVSPDKMHAVANTPFVALGTAADLGTAEQVTPADVASALTALLENPDQRTAMAHAGMHAVDGGGAARIATALKDLADAQT